MNANEKLVNEEFTENVDPTTTEKNVETDGTGDVQIPAKETPPEKIYSQAEFDSMMEEAMGKKVPRMKAKLRKEYESEYGELVRILQAGTGEKDIGKITQSFKAFYEGKGKDMSAANTPQYSPKETAILAKAEADEIIASGMDEVIEEVDRLTKLGLKNMSERDKAVFKTLAEHRKNTERSQEFAKLGVTEDVYNSDEFKNFAAMFNTDTSIKEILSLYNQTKTPKKEIKTMGSMKSTAADNGGVKDYYSFEEASKFSKADFDKNPKLYKAVLNSMTKWK